MTSTIRLTPLRVVAAALALLASPTVPLPAQTPTTPQPRFVDGDLANLSCKVLSLDAKGDSPHRLVVEVQNRGTSSAEPLQFEVTSRGQKDAEPKETFTRAMLPRFARYGRPVLAGGKERYDLTTYLAGNKAQFSVRVVAAVWHEGTALPKPDLHIGEPQQVQRTSLSGAFGVTQVSLTNPFDREVDVLLRVRLVQPVDRVDLYGVRLPVGRSFDWVISSRGSLPVYLPHDLPPGNAVKATEFEVVDWILVGETPKSAGADQLRAAYEGWHRWPAVSSDITGEVAVRGRRKKLNSEDYEDTKFQSSFRVTPDGTVKIEANEASGDARMVLGMAFANLLRPDFETLAARNQLQPLGDSRIALIGPGWDPQQQRGSRLSVAGGTTSFESVEDLEVRNGRIVSSGSGDSPRTTWHTQPYGAGYAVTRRTSASQDFAFSYREDGNRLIPTAAMMTTAFGGNLFSACEVILSGVRFEGAPPPPPNPPTGTGVAALRQMWDSAWHLPTGPIEIAANFEVSNSGTDLIWQGQRRLRGKVVMRGIGRHLEHADFEFEGSHDLARQMALAAVIRDRWGMWYGRDFNDRRPFDEHFAGAVVHAANDQGLFRIENGPVVEVSTSGGLVRGWRQPGLAVEFTYQKFGDVHAVTRIDEAIGAPDAKSQQRWRSSVLVQLTMVKGQLLPTVLQFERIFGKEWGPELITLTNLELR